VILADFGDDQGRRAAADGTAIDQLKRGSAHCRESFPQLFNERSSLE
jgi:hypothetical protein